MGKVLIIVPHEDDEINIAGGIIYSLKNHDEAYIVFVTNGDYMCKAKYRYKEAIKSLKKLEIKKENIIFLGYGDQPYDQKEHMYNSAENWVSKSGHMETYGAAGIKEWNYMKYGKHCLYNKKNLVRNIKEIILDIKPKEIICVDLDFHPDHIMTSLCFEKAMGEILKENVNYKPEVLKSFAYENSYIGENDFFKEATNISKVATENDGTLKSNPYYNIKDGIRINVKEKCYSYNLISNPVYKAIRCHVSQLLVKHTESIINKDYLYWKRNTNNLLNTAKINVTSSEKEYLRDFLIADSNNILNGNKLPILFSEKIWIPEQNDKDKKIDITFDEEKWVNCIRLYNGRINRKYIKSIALSIDDNEKVIALDPIYINELKINRKVKKINIKVLDEVCHNGFSEIEILENKEETQIYDYIENDKKEKIKFDILKRANIYFDKYYLKIIIFLTKVQRKLFRR